MKKNYFGDTHRNLRISVYYIDTNLGNSGFDMLKAFNNQFCMNSNASYLFWSTQKYSKVYLLFAVDAYFPTACLDSPSFPV